jgi:molybdopterin synthase catalytic subunit
MREISSSRWVDNCAPLIVDCLCSFVAFVAPYPRRDPGAVKWRSFSLQIRKGSEINGPMEPNLPICVMPCTLATDTAQPPRSRHTGVLIDVTVRVQFESIDIESAMSAMTLLRGDGTLATFLGDVRDVGARADGVAFEIEHYADVTERALHHAVAVVSARWDVDAVLLIHRIGIVLPSEPVVLVAVAAKRHGAAFSACEFLTDYLKNRAPLWKREVREDEISALFDA